MKVAVLKERFPLETRVAATPESVRKMVGLGLDVIVEKGAGDLSFFSDEAYKEAGAKLVATPAGAIKEADIFLKVRAPILKDEGKGDEKGLLKKGAALIGMLSPYNNSKDLKSYAKASVSAMSLELIPRITRAQSMDVLSSQANLGGYRAVIEAAFEYGRVFPLMMTAAGTVPPAKVLVIGAGVAGLQAIATAKRLGAVVFAFDVRAAAKEQVESLGAKFIEVLSEEAGEGKGGYAKEMSAAYQKRQQEKISDVMREADIVITTALIPGKPAPRLIHAEMVSSMKPGSVIIDMAVAMGGNVEGSMREKVVEKNGVKIIGYENLPGRLPTEASTLYARNVFNFLQLLWDPKAGMLKLDAEDEIIKGCLLTHQGEVIHPNFKE